MEALQKVIGSDADTILWWQMICRDVLIFFYTLLLVRFGGRRFFGKSTSFDIVLGVILGSIMSRALTANAQFLPTLASATADAGRQSLSEPSRKPTVHLFDPVV